MNKRAILLLSLISMTIIFQVNHLAGFNPFSKSDWEDVGKSIKGGFEKGVKFLGKTFNNAKDLVEDAFTRVKECVTVVGLGSAWAAKKAAFETAKASLEAAKKLQVLDPRLVALETAEATAKIALEAGQKSLDAAQLSAQALSKTLAGLSTAAGRGFNIKSMTFEAYMSKLIQSAEGPTFTIDAVLFGQSIKKQVTLDLSKPVDAVKKVVKEVAAGIKEFKDLFVEIILP